MESLKLELGRPGHVLSQPYDTLQHLATDSWIKFTWEFCQTHSTVIHDDTPNFAPLRVHDRYLTHLFMSFTSQKSTLRALQRCCLYLQVTTLSEICTGNGRQIQSTYWDGHRATYSLNSFHWPTQPRPPPSEWAI